jgi:hypothetical protein
VSGAYIDQHLHLTEGSTEKLEGRGRDDYKHFIRQQEAQAYANAVLGEQGFHYRQLGIELPLIKPFNDPEHGFFVGYKSTWGNMDKKSATIVREVVADNKGADIWFIPFPFSGKPHHRHHSAVATQFLKELKAENYEGQIIFYETFETETNFDDAGIVPNVVYTFGEKQDRRKWKDIGLFSSQLFRRKYNALAQQRDEQHYETETQRKGIPPRKGIKYAERFVVGEFTRPGTQESPFGEWPFLRRFYHEFGDGIAGRVLIPILIESVVPAALLSSLHVTSLPVLIAVQVGWQLLHGRESLSKGKTVVSVLTIGLLAFGQYHAASFYSLHLLLSYAVPHLAFNFGQLVAREARLAKDVADEIASRSNGQMNRERSKRLAREFSRAFPLGFDLGRLYTEGRGFDRMLFQVELEKAMTRVGLPRTSLTEALVNHAGRDLVVIPVHDGLGESELRQILSGLESRQAQSEVEASIVFVGTLRSKALADLIADYIHRTGYAVHYDDPGFVVARENGLELNLSELNERLSDLLETSTGVQFVMDQHVGVNVNGLAGDSLLLRAVFTILFEDFRAITVSLQQMNAIREVTELVGRQA